MNEWIEINNVEHIPEDGSQCICCDAYSGRLLIVSYDLEEDELIITGMGELESDCLPTHILNVPELPTIKEE